MKDVAAGTGGNNLTLLLVVVIIGLFLLIGGITRTLVVRDTKILEANAGQSQGIPFSAMFVLIVLGGTVFVGLLAWIFQPDQESASNGFGTLAGLILLGMVVFIGIMNILTLSAARIGMLDGRQPFGLPEGSVRAILTIAFIVLVGVLSSFLLTGSNNRTGYSASGMVLETLKQRSAAETRASTYMQTYGADAIVGIEEVQQLDASGAAAPAFQIRIYPKVDYSVADDISKQTLTMVSTILAAMIGFYFASRSDAGAADPASVQRANALKELRELLKETELEKRLAATREKAKAYNGLAQTRHAADTASLKAEVEKTKAWEGRLADYEKKLETAKAVSQNDKASFSEIDLATTSVRKILEDVAALEKTIDEQQAVLAG